MKPQTYIMLVLWLAVAVSIVTPFVNAQETLGVFKQNDQVQLIQTCSICDYVTLDSIKYPDGTINNVEENMTKVGSTFYYNFTQTSQLGEYIYNTYYGNWTAPVSFEITTDGLNGKLGFTVLILILSLGVIVLGLWKQDAIVTILGSFGLYFIGLNILFYGLDGFKDPVYTWAFGLITLSIAFYVSVRSAWELIID